MDTYHLSDHGRIDDAFMKKLGDIIECKKYVTKQRDVVVYHYHKMREATRMKGKGKRDKSLKWTTVQFQSLEMYTHNQRLLGSQESDHTVSVSVIQIIIFIISKLFKWDLSTIVRK